MGTRKYRILIAALLLTIVASVVPLGQGLLASSGDVLYNGDFEKGFVANSACPGMVGAGWGCFNNGGTAVYGFYDDMWARTVFNGAHSQLIEINTRQIGGDNDRNAGIFQTARVFPGQPYDLSLKGMIRAEEKNTDDPWRYRVFVGFDYNGGTNWQAVSDWRELPWDTYYSRTDPGGFSSYSTRVFPSSHALTVFVRVQRKWGTWYEETDFNLDAISLLGPTAIVPMPRDGGQPQPVGPVPPTSSEGYVAPPAQPGDAAPTSEGYFQPPAQPGEAAAPAPAQAAQPVQPAAPSSSEGYYPPPAQPGSGPVQPTSPSQVMPGGLVCDGPNLLYNGTFEYGFQPNGVANNWWGFTNGGRANYGFYDEMWPPVVSQGTHGQLIEINTKNLPDGTDTDRVAGIAQRVWLHPGATYELSLDAMMREEPVAPEEDFYRYMVEWGYSRSGATDPARLDYRERVPLTTIYPRTEPGSGNMQNYTTRFVAPGGYTTMTIFALKKWATVNRELDVNLDNVVLRFCRQGGVRPVYPVHPIQPIKPVHPVQPVHPVKPVHPIAPVKPAPPSKPVAYGCSDPGDVWYVVQRGDTLSALAAQYNTSVQAIMVKNGLANPNVIYVGQKLCIPDPPAAGYAPSRQVAVVEVEPAVVEPVAVEQYAAPSEPAPAPATMAASENSTAAAPSAYRVQRGDTLSGIAQQHGTTVAALMQVNNIANANYIYAGQRLQLP